ncbi:MAG: hypothetical protein ACTS3F_13480, partial [Phycisphaerales bacterium]
GGGGGCRSEGAIEDAVERIKIETRRFAKNQRTWLRRLRGQAAPAGSPAAAVGDMWLACEGRDADELAQIVCEQWFRDGGSAE